MSSPHHKYHNALNRLPQIGPVRLRKLRAYFPSMQNAWEANLGALLEAGLEEKIAQRMLEARKNIDPDAEWEKLEKENIKIITQEEALFPKYLLEISSAPAMLYVKGKIIPDEFCIAIVGSRKISDYGKRVTEDFAAALSKSGVTLVSGLAYGVDTITHGQCLKLGHRNIAVLGSGLDEKSIYPFSNRRTAREIESCGCLVSEYPVGTPPLRQNFPARNRIISGMAKGILVVEASQTSGSLITARYALEQNRDVFAVPGSIYSKISEGTNNLIKMGAKPVCRAEDILEEYGCELDPAIKQARQIIPDSPEEEIVLSHLTFDIPIHVDKLSLATGIKTASLSSLLTLMEIKGMIKDISGMRYIKK